MSKTYHAIVVGLGSSGSSVLYELAKQSFSSHPSVKIMGIDQYDPPHRLGSSFGESRLIRLVSPQDIDYVDMAKRSLELYREMEQETGIQLYRPTGGLFLGPNQMPGFLNKIQTSAIEQKINHQNLSTTELIKTYPQLKIKSTDEGYYEPTIGLLSPEQCISTRIKLARQMGAEINVKEKFIRFEKYAEKIRIVTDKDQYITEQLILTAGPWMPQILGSDLGAELTVHRSIVLWLKVAEESIHQFQAENFPVIMWDVGNDYKIVIFPITDQRNLLKILFFPSTLEAVTTPETVNRQVSIQEQQLLYEKYVKPNFQGVTSECMESAVCLYTSAPQGRFIIDFLPGYNNKIIAVSACSRQGFKYGPAIGQAVAERVLTHKNLHSFDVFKKFGNYFSRLHLTHNQFSLLGSKSIKSPTNQITEKKLMSKL